VLDPVSDLARLEGVPSAVEAALAAVDSVLRDRGHAATDHDQTVRVLPMLRSFRRSSPTIPTGGCLVGAVYGADRAQRLVRVAPGQVLARAHARRP
jgi:hypothetical protein